MITEARNSKSTIKGCEFSDDGSWLARLLKCLLIDIVVALNCIAVVSLWWATLECNLLNFLQKTSLYNLNATYDTFTTTKEGLCLQLVVRFVITAE